MIPSLVDILSRKDRGERKWHVVTSEQQAEGRGNKKERTRERNKGSEEKGEGTKERQTGDSKEEE